MAYNPYNPYTTYSPYANGYNTTGILQNNPGVMNNNQPVQQQQLQNGGVVIVQNEKEAQDYLVANGTSVTFIDMNARKVYVKTKGFSTFDVPVFESYSLVKDVDKEAPEASASQYASKEEIELLKKDIEKLRADMALVKETGNE
ncbi:hypothetical protein [Ruminococcus sp.]|uniref:hypothetical protein n=1 Tax=Ruminococcus sp. TaxID=41978 RepID=UPI00388E5D6C